MTICPKCGKNIPANANFCQECGYKLTNVNIPIREISGDKVEVEERVLDSGEEIVLEVVAAPVQLHTCSTCKKAYDSSYYFCPYCGEAKNTHKRCPKCSRLFSGKDNFCPNCGNELISKNAPKNFVPKKAKKEPNKTTNVLLKLSIALLSIGLLAIVLFTPFYESKMSAEVGNENIEIAFNHTGKDVLEYGLFAIFGYSEEDALEDIEDEFETIVEKCQGKSEQWILENYQEIINEYSVYKFTLIDNDSELFGSYRLQIIVTSLFMMLLVIFLIVTVFSSLISLSTKNSAWRCNGGIVVLLLMLANFIALPNPTIFTDSFSLDLLFDETTISGVGVIAIVVASILYILSSIRTMMNSSQKPSRQDIVLRLIAIGGLVWILVMASGVIVEYDDGTLSYDIGVFGFTNQFDYIQMPILYFAGILAVALSLALMLNKFPVSWIYNHETFWATIALGCFLLLVVNIFNSIEERHMYISNTLLSITGYLIILTIYMITVKISTKSKAIR